MLDLENCVEVKYPHSLISFEEIDSNLTYSHIKNVMKRRKLDFILEIVEKEGEYKIKEFKNGEDFSQTEMSLKEYREFNPRNWVSMREGIREERPDILKEMGDCHKNASPYL